MPISEFNVPGILTLDIEPGSQGVEAILSTRTALYAWMGVVHDSTQLMPVDLYQPP